MTFNYSATAHQGSRVSIKRSSSLLLIESTCRWSQSSTFLPWSAIQFMLNWRIPKLSLWPVGSPGYLYVERRMLEHRNSRLSSSFSKQMPLVMNFTSILQVFSLTRPTAELDIRTVPSLASSGEGGEILLSPRYLLPSPFILWYVPLWAVIRCWGLLWQCRSSSWSP